VRTVGLEPTQPFGYQDLNLAAGEYPQTYVPYLHSDYRESSHGLWNACRNRKARRSSRRFSGQLTVRPGTVQHLLNGRCEHHSARCQRTQKLRQIGNAERCEDRQDTDEDAASTDDSLDHGTGIKLVRALSDDGCG
jgi:hypothetical protein